MTSELDKVDEAKYQPQDSNLSSGIWFEVKWMLSECWSNEIRTIPSGGDQKGFA